MFSFFSELSSIFDTLNQYLLSAYHVYNLLIIIYLPFWRINSLYGFNCTLFPNNSQTYIINPDISNCNYLQIFSFYDSEIFCNLLCFQKRILSPFIYFLIFGLSFVPCLSVSEFRQITRHFKNKLYKLILK